MEEKIKRNDFVRYLKNIYLVKDFQKLENGKFQLSYYFRSTKNDNAKLHIDNSEVIYAYLIKNIRKASEDDIRLHSPG